MRRKVLIYRWFFLLAISLLPFSSCHKEQEEYARNLMEALDRGKDIQTRNAMNQIASCLNRYLLDHGSYPEGDEINVVVHHLTPSYAQVLSTLDGWGSPFYYFSDGQQFILSSAGEDKIFHTQDDIVMIDGTFR